MVRFWGLGTAWKGLETASGVLSLARSKANESRMSEACLASCKSGAFLGCLGPGPGPRPRTRPKAKAQAPKLQPKARPGPKPGNTPDLHDARLNKIIKIFANRQTWFGLG